MGQQFPIKIVPIEGINLDSDATRIKQTQAIFIKNMTTNQHRNANADNNTTEGGNEWVGTPLEGNEIQAGLPSFPAGKNICVGAYESPETYETYVFVYNHNGNHFIYVMGQFTVPTIVYKNADLKFSLNPELYISKGRCVLKTRYNYNESTGNAVVYKFLIFTDSQNHQRQIEVMSSIATNYYDVTLPYFDNTNNTYDRSKIINLGVSTPSLCIAIQPIERTDSDKYLQNQLVNNLWQWRAKHTTIFGQPSEHGMISDLWTPIIGAGCVSSAVGIPRCVKLNIELGNPLVNKIQIEFKKGNGDWYLYDTVDKYDNSNPATPWYERNINPDLLDYDAVTNTFNYIFCADKDAQLLDQEEVSRIENYLPIKSASVFSIDLGIGLANNTRGFSPINDTELEKVRFTVTPPSGVDCDINDLMEIVVYAVIRNNWVSQVGMFYNNLLAFSPTIKYQWGIITNSDPSPEIWGQHPPLDFPDQKGFIGYLEGTDHKVISEQVTIDNVTFVEVPLDTFDPSTPPVLTGKTVFQKFRFLVTRGVYSFRIAHHQSKIGDPECTKTSTYARGIVKMNDPFTLINEDRELIIDVSNGSYNSRNANTPVIQILDFFKAKAGSPPSGDTPQYVLIEGYFYESENSPVGIPLAPLIGGDGSFLIPYTDHNGFYFAAWDEANASVGGLVPPAAVSIDTCGDGTKVAIINAPFDTNQHAAVATKNVFAYTGNAEFPDYGRIEIRGNVTLCDEIIGVSGALIVMKYGKHSISDETGEYVIYAYTRQGIYDDDPIYLIFSQGGCVFYNCGTSACDFLIPPFTTPYIPCNGTTQRRVELDPIAVRISGVGIKGLQNGGRYRGCLNAFDDAGRRRFAASTENFVFDIPPISETHVFDFSTVGWIIDPSMQLPLDVAYITFGITKNLNYSDFQSWIVDQKQRVDASGFPDPLSGTYLRIYYSSQSEYNKNLSFNTNATWQVLSQLENGQRLGDMVEFIRNGDGTWFDERITSIIQYDSTGVFFTIPYRQAFDNLKEGALIKLIRPKALDEEYKYFELCGKIPVVNGVPSILSGTLNAFDAYMVSRQIPVPLVEGETTIFNNDTHETVNPSGDNYSAIQSNYPIKFKHLVSTTDPVSISQGFPAVFEHHAPSDLWGDHNGNWGRINVKNANERVKYLENEIALSKPYADASDVNGLSYFWEEDTSAFNQEEWGGIMSVLPDNNILLVICEFDHFITGFRQSGLTAGQDGVVSASQNIGNFSIPRKRPGQEFGCQKYFINTIQKHKGIVYWLDGSRQALVQCDYSTSRDMSSANEQLGVIGGYKSYLNKKIEWHNVTRSTSSITSRRPIFIGGINPRNNEYLLTYNEIPFGTLLNTTDPLYVNNSNELNYTSRNDTIIIDLYKGYLKSFAMFTPEYYTNLEQRGGRLIALRLGSAWNHYNENPTDPLIYNNFFGTQGRKVIEVIFNKGSEKVKRWLFTQVYAKEHLMVADRIISEVGQLSRILSAHWRQGEHFKQAPFLCDVNTVFQNAQQPDLGPLAIVAGELLSGRWLKVRYVSETADDSKYIEISALVATVLGLDKTDE